MSARTHSATARPSLCIASALAWALALGACNNSGTLPPAGDAAMDTGSHDGAVSCGADGSEGGADGACGACTPQSRRCDPDHPDTVQTCADDGSGWQTGERCAPDDGMACIQGRCANPCARAGGADGDGASYLGCEFWPATLGNPLLMNLNGLPFAVAVANPQTYWVTVTLEGGALTAPLSQQLAPGTLAVLTPPWVNALVGAEGSVLVRQGAYHLRSTGPIIAYQFNPLTFHDQAGHPSSTNDASLLLPAAALTEHYTGLTTPGGYLTVVGVSDTPTQVAVTPSTAIIPGDGVAAAPQGAMQLYQLARGDVLQLAGEAFGGYDNPGGDLTGTTIEASAPVAVFAGHPCDVIYPDDPDLGQLWTCDHLEDQLLPNETWGQRYAVSALIDRPGVPFRVRVMALQSGTTLAFDPPSAAPAGLPATLDAHASVDFEASADFVVTSNHPVLVAQFMVSAHGNPGTPESEGDPSLVFEVPTEQYRADSLILTPSTYTRSFMNVVGPSAAPPLIDGVATTTPGHPIGASGLSTWDLPADPGTHRISAPDMTSVYGVKVYGIAPYTSYAYPGGLELRPIGPPG